MIFLISSESETDILQRLYFPMVRRRGSGSRPLMPLQGVPHQRFEVGDARGKSHHHPFGPFVIPADRHGVLHGLIQCLPSVGSDIVEGGAHFGIGGRNFFYQHRCRPFRRWSKGEELGPLDGFTGVITTFPSSPCSSSSVETRNLNGIARITHRRHRSFLGLCTRQACSKVPAVRECPHIHDSTSPPFPLCMIQ